MRPQYLADRSSSQAIFEAFVTQPQRLTAEQYDFMAKSAMLRLGGQSATTTSIMRQSGGKTPEQQDRINRRSKCRRNSRSLRRSVRLHSLQPARSPKKNSWLSNLSRSARNRLIPGNTNKGPSLLLTGRAVSPDLLCRGSAKGRVPC